MGCGRSVIQSAGQQTPLSVGQHTSAQQAGPLGSRKWTLLMDWTSWSVKDQFGFDQPPLSDVVGPNTRSKLSGQERPHDYQVGR